MKSNQLKFAFASTLLAVSAQLSFAQSGTWTNLGGGSWPTAGNWSGSTVANGADNTADFSTLDIVANATVTLDGARTIGNLVFGDATTPSNNWLLNTGSGGPLTLDVTAGTPTITVNNQTATTGVVLAGNDGLAKAGAGTLILNSAVSTFTGNVTVSAGAVDTGTTAGGGTNGYFGAVVGGRTITIQNSGTQVNFKANNQFGGGGKTAATIPSVVIDGATLNSTRYNILGNVTLDDGAILTQSSTDTGTGGSYQGYDFIGGTVTVSGAGASTISTGNSKQNHLAGGRTTTFDVADTTGSSAADLVVSAGFRNTSGDYPTGNGALTKTGVGTMSLTGASTGSSIFTVNQGTLSITSGGGIFRGGYSGDSASYVNVNSGGTLELQNWQYSESTGSLGGLSANQGRFTVNGGTVRMNNTSATTYGRAVNVGTNGATLDANGSALWTIDTVIDSNAWVYTGDPTLTLTGSGNGEFQKVINSGNGGLIKNGAGTWTLKGANTYSGTTAVNNGTLLVNGSHTGTGLATVGASGILGGTGSLAADLSIGGTLAPGNSIESLGAGSVSFTNGSTFAYELDSSALNGDLLDSTGTLDLAGTVTLTLTQLASGSLTNGDKLTLISYAGGWTSGELFTYLSNSLADDSTFTLGSNTWLFNYNDTSGGSNFSGDQSGATSFVTMTVVPEPGSFAMLLFGSAMLWRMRKRSR